MMTIIPNRRPFYSYTLLAVLAVGSGGSRANIVAWAYDKARCESRPHGVSNLSPNFDPKAPGHFKVVWRTTAADSEPIVVEAHRKWSPYGVDRFYQLIKDNYYDCAAFFRVVPGKRKEVTVILLLRSNVLLYGPSPSRQPFSHNVRVTLLYGGNCRFRGSIRDRVDAGRD